jgi:hypothetical protein
LVLGTLGIYRVGAITLVVGELEKCKLDLVGVQVGWKEEVYQTADNYTFLYGKAMLITN